ncbi:MAG: peptidase penicillin amidase [Acidobacteriaceae bacterium]|nr:peptidase penicillin amidase [Acidobacteriaceae bacterium]
MKPEDNAPDELDLLRNTPVSDSLQEEEGPIVPSRLPRNLAIGFTVVLLLLIAAFFGARLWTNRAMRDNLAQLDGSVSLTGLGAPVTVRRDNHGVPSIQAASLDDLIVAQGFVTAQDRLWQMETLRRHGAGTIAELFGSTALAHDRLQRTLRLRAAADRALTVLPPDQLHFLELYARGVNASMEAQRSHLPLEFRLLHVDPAPWTPSDSLLVGLVMFQDLTNSFTTKLSREVLTTRLHPTLLADLYPVGSWRDHPPAQPQIDLTTPVDKLPEIPLDPSQTGSNAQRDSFDIAALLTLQKSMTRSDCEGCIAGSNNWTVSGTHTASGKPLLSNDMHLALSVPGIWYETSLYARMPSGEPFHVAGVSLPGTPFVIVGHNDHVAWGFTNLGADVQDIFVERFRKTPNGPEFQSPDITWHPVLHHAEIIHVRGGKDVTLDVLATQHGALETPIISALVIAHPPAGQPTSEGRPLALAWTIYDPANVTSPFLGVNSAHDWTSITAAFSTWGGPAQNMVYADDQGHIGYHALGKIPLRGSIVSPSSLAPIPVSGLDPSRQWTGYILFDQLPQVFDPPSGIIATANARITPDSYPFPVTLNWAAPYRNERIWKVLSASQNLTPADMLKLQTDVYSDLDHVVAQRLAYAIDHANPRTSDNPKRLHQAADLLRNWNGRVDAGSSAPNIVDAARAVLWPMLLTPRIGADATQLYTWGEKAFAEEQIILHTPDRWLPSKEMKWDDLLASAVDKGLSAANAPNDLSKWAYGKSHPIDIEHPIFSISPLLDSILGTPTGTGPLPQSGGSTTVKQVGRSFGPSERLTVDFSNLDQTTLNVVLGQSGNPLSPWFMDQFNTWYHGTTQPLPFSTGAVQSSTTHTLTLTP